MRSVEKQELGWLSGDVSFSLYSVQKTSDLGEIN